MRIAIEGQRLFRTKKHGMDMFQKQDTAHIQAMQKMRDLMQTADSKNMAKWLKEKRLAFEAKPEE